MAKNLDKYSALTLDELFVRRDEPATEPVPPRSDVYGYISSREALRPLHHASLPDRRYVSARPVI